MKILSADQIRALDAFTIQNEPISSIDLMERASATFVNWFIEHFNPDREVYIFCGPGNNGGDGLAVARLLTQVQYSVKVFVFPSDKYSADFEINFRRLEKLITISKISSTEHIPVFPKAAVVIDAIFGSGLSRPVGGLYADVIKSINESSTIKIAIDIASGLFCDSNNEDSVKVKVDYTFTFQLPKLSFLLPQNEKFTGSWIARDIGLDKTFIEDQSSVFSYVNEGEIFPLVKPRKKFSHKGDYGKALIMAGSFGMMGAAVLSGKACYRAGAGLVKFYTPKCGVQILQSALPEAILSADPEENFISKLPDLAGFNAVAAGPGWYEGDESTNVLRLLFENKNLKLVLDAGALNVLSKNKDLLKSLPDNTILTPHPGEFKRLAGDFPDDYSRLDGLRKFSAKYKCIVVLKGANTMVASPDGNVSFNSTGNPGMATAGSGDVLTGIIVSLLAQGYTPSFSAKLGVYLHGYAGDSAASKYGTASIIAEDIIEGIKDFYLKCDKSFSN
ncbi:bifunctional ADP-dependent NAD(P)H-hydrate dehydratase/NAD(P)H-hydrate epimerase [Sporocytophaga myxococcoides]|uniref:bifunctional ADP-dependent NAD(P)H-hydrate dehydratase/NAD(P)H-hydrate epimerase n=1 Tax=Sporocytophaga myxococcoides TaxID=153721 RepID=UPI00040FEEF1|nr:bifunctional ADP-dependent NAD(P)H-hydrate dehydratase/NAD(P)H-hydrate epimerase [Sporocytophaga myxococcoides]